MPPELRREFQAYLIASVSLYDVRSSTVPEDIREMAEWLGEAYTTFIHKAEDLRAQGII